MLAVVLSLMIVIGFGIGHPVKNATLIVLSSSLQCRQWHKETEVVKILKIAGLDFETLIWLTRTASAYEQSKTEAKRKVAVNQCQ